MLKNEEFKIVDMLSRDFAITDICAMMGVSRAGYYKWKRRDPSTRDLNRETMVEFVEQMHSEHSTHGYRWVVAFIRNELRATVSDNFVYKCFRYLGIQSETRPCFAIGYDTPVNYHLIS